MTIDVIDPKGTVVRTFTNAPPRGRRGGACGRPRWWRWQVVAAARRRRRRHGVAMNPGFNTVTWDLRYPGATSFPGMILWGGGTTGPLAAPGTYQVRMTADGRVADPTAARAPQSDFHATSATPICRRSSIWRFRFATRRAKRTTP